MNGNMNRLPGLIFRKALKLSIHVIISLFFMTLSLAPIKPVSAASIARASATGSPLPPLAIYPDQLSVRNGDFTIRPPDDWPPQRETRLGDGTDEVTTWAFDLTSDMQRLLSSNLEQWEAVILTLALKPGPNHSNDDVQIAGLPEIGVPEELIGPRGQLLPLI